MQSVGPIGKPSEWMSSFWTVRFLKTESEQNFGFPHIPKSGDVLAGHRVNRTLHRYKIHDGL